MVGAGDPPHLPVRDKCFAINFDALIQAHKFQLVKQGEPERTATTRTDRSGRRGGRGRGVRPS